MYLMINVRMVMRIIHDHDLGAESLKNSAKKCGHNYLSPIVSSDISESHD